MIVINYDFGGFLFGGDLQRQQEKRQFSESTIENFNIFCLKVFTYKLCSKSCRREFTLNFIN